MKTAEFAPPGCKCDYCLSKKTAGLSVGDRDLPLEADIVIDPVRTGPMIGKTIEVSEIAGGELKGMFETQVQISGLLYRFGVVSGYEVTCDKGIFYGSLKDFYVDREYLEDIQPPTSVSAALRGGLSHWSQQRDYWHTQADGLEALCFELASITPSASVTTTSSGWNFYVPSLMPGDSAVVDCRAVMHEKFWSMSSMVYPIREATNPPAIIQDHWERTFNWAHQIATEMCGFGFPWEKEAHDLLVRRRATSKLLEPLVRDTLVRCALAKRELTGEDFFFGPGSVSVGFSDVRLKAGTIGLTEPPTDRRPYSVMTISPGAVKKPGYLKQVVLHECIHMVVASTGGPAHNDEFNALAEHLGLTEENRD